MRQLDLSDPQAGGQQLAQLINSLGRIDVLVNNAGVMTKADFLDVSFEDWRKVFTVDVDGAFVCGQIAARHMVDQGDGGRIINITSVHEHTPLPDAAAYTAAKHALGGLTKSMALSLMPHHILVNAVAPGAIATPMNDMSNSEAHSRRMPEIPIGRPAIRAKSPVWWRGFARNGPLTPPGSHSWSTAASCWPTRSSRVTTVNRRGGGSSGESQSAARCRTQSPPPAR